MPPCAESLRVQAYFDGEVDAPAAADIERHLEDCTECRALLEDLERARTAVRSLEGPSAAPAALRGRILSALDEEAASSGGSVPGFAAVPAPSPAPGQPAARRDAMETKRPFWWGALSGFCVAGAAASMAFLLVTPPKGHAVLDAVVSAHVRSLMPSHLIDVESTDRHTVKPWFAGHADVSPVVADFADRGFRLVGGRADYVDGERAAVVVYQHGPHIVNVFSWASTQRVPNRDVRNGYHLECWHEGNLANCAVSDTSWDELSQLVDLLKGLSAADTRN